MTNSTTSQDGTTWYYVNYEGLNSCSIIFNNGSGGNNNQTWDITGVSGTQYFYSNGSNSYLNLTSVKDKTAYAFFENTNNWSGNLYAHCWNGSYSTNWNGDQMTFVGGTNGGRSVYAWSTNNGIPGMIIFNNGSSQTSDLTFRNGYYYSNNGNTTNNNYTNLSFPTLPTPVTPHYYITGDNGLGLGGFTCVPTLELTDSDEDGIYTYTATASADGTYNFVFANGQGANSSDWTNFNNNYRIGPTSGNVTVTLNGAFQNTQLSGGDHGAYQVTVAAGTVMFSLRPADMQFKVEGTVPVITYDYYVVGDIFPNGWNTGASTQMTDNNGTYTWTSGQMHLDAGTNYEYKVLDSSGAYHPSGANATFHADVPGTYTVTVTYDSNSGTVNAVPNLVQADPTYTYTFYVLPDDGSVTPTLYLWGTNNNNYHPLGDWAGTAMNDTEVLDDGNTWYKWTGALYANLMNAIVNNGGNGHQTTDIASLAPDTYYIRWNVNDNTITITTDAPEPGPPMITPSMCATRATERLTCTCGTAVMNCWVASPAPL